MAFITIGSMQVPLEARHFVNVTHSSALTPPVTTRKVSMASIKQNNFPYVSSDNISWHSVNQLAVRRSNTPVFKTRMGDFARITHVRKGDELVAPKRNNAHFRRYKMYEGVDHTVDTITIHDNDKRHIIVDEPAFAINNPVKKRHQAKSETRNFVKASVTQIMAKLAKIVARNNLQVEVIDQRKRISGQMVHRNKRKLLQLEVSHLCGRHLPVDITTTQFQKEIITCIARRTDWCSFAHTASITPGFSGCVLSRAHFVDSCKAPPGDLLIIRGKHEGKIVDARLRLPKQQVRSVTHYSDVGSKFWKGLDGNFSRFRPRIDDHTCESNLDVTRCGAVMALLIQTFYPCGRITCLRCVQNRNKQSNIEAMRQFSERARESVATIKSEFSEFTHVVTILEKFQQMASAENNNREAFGRIKFMIGERTNDPFAHVNSINEILIKGNEITTDEYNRATGHLREIASYLKNRTEHIQKGSLQSFRNKFSSKTHLNTALMCDNQLDKNGNFIWGERGYHAKRFFQNYFEVVDPTNGYEKHIVRMNPNGSRRLAIGNLIVSTDLEALREQLRGQPVDSKPLTKACVAKRHESFIHVCSCVTHDDGAPVHSEILTPTKNHLVLGNTGDPKYLDLPTDISEKLFIAKEGYCYVNIFLAMLVNICENEAKDFTKRVRDIVVHKLGKWPSMADVATECYLLTMFHPDTRSAELPKILVDHVGKTMHVIDSYGSLTTGYHVLKANTVNQLIQFASDSLDSEMKDYLVGGFNTEKRAHAILLQLAKSVFNPNKLRILLEEDPYILTLSVLSPSMLRAVTSSSSFVPLLQQLANSDLELYQILTYATALAKKIRTSDLLEVQFGMIEEGLHYIHSIVPDTPPTSLAHRTLRDILDNSVSSSLCNQQLHKNGFIETSKTLKMELEKIYQNALDASFQELCLQEKLRYYMYKMKSMRYYICETGSNDVRETYNSCVNSAQQFSSVVKTHCVKKAQVIRTLSGRTIKKCILRCFSICSSALISMVPDIFKVINLLIVLSLLLTISNTLQRIAKEVKRSRRERLEIEHQSFIDVMEKTYEHLKVKIGMNPTYDEFSDFLSQINPKVHKVFLQITHDDEVMHQAKGANEIQLEKIIASSALVMMVFDSDRSDALYKILNKLKGLMGTLDQSVQHQSLDEIAETFDMNETVNFTLDDHTSVSTIVRNPTFAQWWSNQLQYNNTMPHYRTEGHFVEFTRLNASMVSSEIATSTHTDFLIRGAVGSGKSTGLPFHLSKKGSVLLLEPTKPLTENVCTQLRNEPFYVKPTMRYRGASTFGSSPITVMTTGFALHHYAHNRHLLNSIDFIIIDECHVVDSNAMAMCCLLKEVEFKGKLLKVSATPPGREVEFATQHPVRVIVEESSSLSKFVTELGTKSALDATQYGHNTLVYVASYNEVDYLSKALLDKGYLTTKIDGRTMKSGPVAISTHGSEKKHHFIVATNIIENGVTLDIDVVVDFGVKVVATLDEDNRMVRYTKQPISFGERIQRLGRVGRHKPGVAIRIGHTEKGAPAIPTMVATEAAFLSFTYGLPVMTANVSTNLLGNCTVLQAKTMLTFELSIYFMVFLVRFDGSIHPAIHDEVKQFKLNDSAIPLNKLAIPHSGVNNWFTSAIYSALGASLQFETEIRLPFYVKDVPHRVYANLWKIIMQHKGDAGFGRVRSANVSKIAYTLRTDPSAIHKTIQIIDELLCGEMEKKAQFEALTHQSCTATGFTLNSIILSLRSKYAQDYTAENISILQAAKSSLMEFSNLCVNRSQNGGESDRNLENDIAECGALESVLHQSASSVSTALNLKGKWQRSLITQDALLLLGTLGFGSWLVYSSFMKDCNTEVTHQGFNKRARQKLKFRAARDSRVGQEVFADNDTIEHYFGSQYIKKGKVKGTKRGMGIKNKRFINMYGFDPTEYNYVRFVDPMTGETRDESVLVDMSLVTQLIFDKRTEAFENDELDSQLFQKPMEIEAYFVNDHTKKALKVDLSQHNPLAVGVRTNTISGFPERKGELRQVGTAVEVNLSKVPAPNEEVDHESKSLFRGIRDYNSISAVICRLKNNSDGHSMSIYGIGYGPFIVTNQHLFKQNNGEILITSRHGEFKVANSTSLQIKPINGSDIALIRMPKDFPPFPQKLKFRPPAMGERVCIVASNFQDKSISSSVSESSTTHPVAGSTFWKHWIDTKDGHCGLPLVSTQDGAIVGLHSLTSTSAEQNFHACVTSSLVDLLSNISDIEGWVKHWKYNPNDVCWGTLKLQQSEPNGLFKPCKTVVDLSFDLVQEQGKEDWVYNSLKGNLKGVARSSSQLVTKHVVKGKCPLFQTYLNVDNEARAFFNPLMGSYQKSVLNKTAYLQDILKYSSEIVVGNVRTDDFEIAVMNVIATMTLSGFKPCVYITDPETIYGALNMKAATGALYAGRKREYFETLTDSEREQILFESCRRLYTGKKGIWNGSLKAELRPIEKVLANKTRTFTAAPLDTLLSGKVCVDEFNNQFYDLNLKCPWTVGMTKFYKGWHKLLTALPDDWVYCDADGSQFDSSLSPYIINAVLQIRLHFMENWDIGEEMLRNLYTEIIYTPILTPDGTIIKKCKGNNSGQPSTVVDNSLMVIIAVYYAVQVQGVQLSEITNFLTFFVNGDDLLIAIRPDHEWLLDTFQTSFLQLGLKYTFESRTKSKSELWFMSHRGILRDDTFIPKLEKERIVSILEWDRSVEAVHRLEAICASMIEAWGYDDLLHEIRRFYQWVLEQEPYKSLAADGKAPYLAETALRKLYLDVEADESELLKYYKEFAQLELIEGLEVRHQSGEQIDAGAVVQGKKDKEVSSSSKSKDKDVDVGSTGTYSVPRLSKISSKLKLPMVLGKPVINLNHLLQYTPDQVDISNTRATQAQFKTWYQALRDEYGLDDDAMGTVLNGLMVWCIENGTSPNINGYWTMMDGQQQVEFPLRPVLENAKPTFRQIMAHFSNLAEAYIEKRNYDKPYMPRYGLQRNLTDMSLARFAFDFYEMTSTTPARAREAHLQMKAAALRNASTRLFGLDGKVGTTGEDTERHTTDDANQKLHNFAGVRGVGV